MPIATSIAEAGTTRAIPVRIAKVDKVYETAGGGRVEALCGIDLNVAYGPRQRCLPRSEITARTARYLELVQLGGFAGHYPHQLSGGMQQRVAIARVLANDPAVLLMDEPFGALDSLTRAKLQAGLRDIWRQLRPTVLFVTHSAEEAVFLANRVVVMSGGPNYAMPGHVTAVHPVDLDHPRDATSPEFNDIKHRLLDAIHDEEL